MDLKQLEDGIRTVFREGGEEMARSICVGSLVPFGLAVIAHEKALAAARAEKLAEFSNSQAGNICDLMD